MKPTIVRPATIRAQWATWEQRPDNRLPKLASLDLRIEAFATKIGQSARKVRRALGA